MIEFIGGKSRARFEVFRDSRGEWRWRLRANNGRIVAQSEGYVRKVGAERGARAVQIAAGEAQYMVDA